MKKALKILMLEDSTDDVEMIQRLLKKEMLNCEFFVTMTREGYLHALDQFQPHLILSDNYMPQFNATEALLIMKQHSIQIPFIMVTGTVSEEFAADIIKMGAEDYILKDRLTRLPAAIDAALKHRKAEKEKQETEKKILVSENNLRAIFENASEGFLLLDNNAVIKSFNSKAGKYTFVITSKEIAVGQSIFDFIEEPRKEFFQKLITKVLHGERIQYERAHDWENGLTSWIDFSITPVVEGAQVKGICITGRDITEKKNKEEELKKSFNEKEALAQRMSVILNSLPANIALLDEQGTIIDVNVSWRNFADEDGFIGSNYTIGDNYIDIAKKTSGKAEADGKKVAEGIQDLLNKKVDEFVFEYACHSPKLKRWFRMVATPLQEKNYAGAVVMHIDISELRKLEHERLENQLTQQKKITKAMIKGQEKERNFIGQELHDNINQILAGTKMYLSSAGKKNDELKELIKYPMELIDSSIEEIRLLCQRLVTPNININLQELVQQLLTKLTKNSAIKTDFLYVVPGEMLSDDLKLNIYRIVQEQLNNILKYAEAKKINISIEVKSKNISTIIEDDGKGFDVYTKREGIGISNMINRAESFNGSVEINSKPGKGCNVIITIPVS